MYISWKKKTFFAGNSSSKPSVWWQKTMVPWKATNMWYTLWRAPDTFGSSPRHPRVPALIYVFFCHSETGNEAESNHLSISTSGILNKIDEHLRFYLKISGIWPSIIVFQPSQTGIYHQSNNGFDLTIKKSAFDHQNVCLTIKKGSFTITSGDMTIQVVVLTSKIWNSCSPNEDLYNHWRWYLTLVWSSSIRCYTGIWRVYHLRLNIIKHMIEDRQYNSSYFKPLLRSGNLT